MIRPKLSLEKEDETTFSRAVSFVSGTQRSKRHSKRRLNNVWRNSKIDPDFSAVECAAKLGYLPGLAFRSSPKVNWHVAVGGTSPVENAAFANVPLCVSDQRGSGRRGHSRQSGRCSAQNNPRCENAMRKHQCSESQWHEKRRRCFVPRLGDLYCSTPYDPSQSQSTSSMANLTNIDRSMQCVPLVRSGSAKQSRSTSSENKHQHRKAALLLQVCCWQRLFNQQKAWALQVQLLYYGILGKP